MGFASIFNVFRYHSPLIWIAFPTADRLLGPRYSPPPCGMHRCSDCSRSANLTLEKHKNSRLARQADDSMACDQWMTCDHWMSEWREIGGWYVMSECMTCDHPLILLRKQRSHRGMHSFTHHISFIDPPQVIHWSRVIHSPLPTHHPHRLSFSSWHPNRIIRGSFWNRYTSQFLSCSQFLAVQT